MKQFILIVITAAVFWGCEDGAEFYNNEVVVSKDCTDGDETGMEFDSDSVRCGEKGHIYFGLGKVDEKNDFSPFKFYLFHDNEATKSLDSIWILETDSVKISTCEKLKYSQKKLPGVFCLHKIDNAVRRETVNLFFNPEKNDCNYYFIYSKHDAYKAFCNVDVSGCLLRYSCVVQYDEIYNFSKIPDANDVDWKIMGCLL